MFGIFQNKGMKKALKDITENIENNFKKSFISDELYFSNDELKIVVQIPLFKNIESRYQSYSLSGYGGLAWFMAQFLRETVKKIKTEQNFPESLHSLAHKLCFCSITLVDSIPRLSLSKEDINPIMEAGFNAKAYFELMNGDLLNELESVGLLQKFEQ